MSEGKILDIAHISFLDMIKIMITLSGAASAKGTLIRNAIKTADKISEVDYPAFEDYVVARFDSYPFGIDFSILARVTCEGRVDAD